MRSPPDPPARDGAAMDGVVGIFEVTPGSPEKSFQATMILMMSSTDGALRFAVSAFIRGPKSFSRQRRQTPAGSNGAAPHRCPLHDPERLVQFRFGLGVGQADVLQHMTVHPGKAVARTMAPPGPAQQSHHALPMPRRRTPRPSAKQWPEQLAPGRRPVGSFWSITRWQGWRKAKQCAAEHELLLILVSPPSRWGRGQHQGNELIKSPPSTTLMHDDDASRPGP